MSKMKFCFYFYEKSKHPKFYDEACRILAKGMRSAFTSQNEVDIFVHMVKEALQEHQPDGHSSRVSHNFSADGGQICIESGNIDDDIARLHYHTIDKFLEYNLEAQDFFNVSERYETKGGEA